MAEWLIILRFILLHEIQEWIFILIASFMLITSWVLVVRDVLRWHVAFSATSTQATERTLIRLIVLLAGGG